MPRMVVAVAAAGLLHGCTAEASETALGAASPGQVQCIEAQQITARRITGAQSLEFDVGGATYRNDLPGACPGLEQRMPQGSLALEVNGSRICAGDGFRAFDALEARAVGATAFPRCRLGRFTPVQPSR